jgi:CBS domain containing-hemolysin-like protein
MSGTILLNIALVLLLVFINGFFVAAEFSLVKLRSSEVKLMVRTGSKTAKIVERLINRLDSYLSACQLGITLASLALGWVGEPLVARMLLPAFHLLAIPEKSVHLFAFPIAFVIITFLHITLGEQVPKILSIRKHRAVSLAVSIPLVVFHAVFKPFIWALNASSNAMLRVIGIRPGGEHGETPNEEELRQILYQSAELGYLKPRERFVMENLLDMEDKLARSYMVPRNHVVFINREDSMEDKLRLAAKSGHTRFPLCEGDLDHTVGILHIKDIFQLMTEEEPIEKLLTLTRKPLFFPETMRLDSLLIALQKKRTMMAMLVDEFGTFSGLITMENILEELVGSIEDEFDNEQPLFIKRGSDVYDVDALCPKETIVQLLKIDFPESRADTIGGVIMDLMGEIPEKGDKIEFSGHEVTITAAEPTRIMRMTIKKLKQEPGSNKPGS